jgi:hypothetical protein
MGNAAVVVKGHAIAAARIKTARTIALASVMPVIPLRIPRRH